MQRQEKAWQTYKFKKFNFGAIYGSIQWSTE